MTKQMELSLRHTLRSAQLMPEQVNFEGLQAEEEVEIQLVPMLNQASPDAERIE